jgi:hypothetical protein
MAHWTYQVNPRNFQMDEMLRYFRFNSRISRSALGTNPILKSCPFASWYRGTMRRMTERQASELGRLAGEWAPKESKEQS